MCLGADGVTPLSKTKCRNRYRYVTPSTLGDKMRSPTGGRLHAEEEEIHLFDSCFIRYRTHNEDNQRRELGCRARVDSQRLSLILPSAFVRNICKIAYSNAQLPDPEFKQKEVFIHDKAGNFARMDSDERPSPEKDIVDGVGLSTREKQWFDQTMGNRKKPTVEGRQETVFHNSHHVGRGTTGINRLKAGAVLIASRRMPMCLLVHLGNTELPPSGGSNEIDTSDSDDDRPMDPPRSTSNKNTRPKLETHPSVAPTSDICGTASPTPLCRESAAQPSEMHRIDANVTAKSIADALGKEEEIRKSHTLRTNSYIIDDLRGFGAYRNPFDSCVDGEQLADTMHRIAIARRRDLHSYGSHSFPLKACAERQRRQISALMIMHSRRATVYY